MRGDEDTGSERMMDGNETAAVKEEARGKLVGKWKPTRPSSERLAFHVAGDKICNIL